MSEKDRVRVTFETEVPSHWRYVTLKEVVPPGGVFSDGDWVESKDQDPEGEVRLIQLADIGDGRFLDKSDRYLTREKAGELNCTMLEEGDLLVARMPDPLGRACLFPGSTRPCCTVVDVCIVRTAENNVDHRWLMHAVNSPQFRAAVSGLKSGTTRERISRKNLARIEFPVPPLPEQRRIVAKIEELFSNLDAGMADLQAAGQQLERYRLSVLQAAVEGRLTADWRSTHDPEPADQLLERILEEREKKWYKSRYKDPVEPEFGNSFPEAPDGWTVTSLDSVLSHVTSGPRGWSDYYHEGNGVFILAQNVGPGQLDFSETKNVNPPSDASGRDRAMVQKDDLLVTIVGANTGDVCRVGRELDEHWVCQSVEIGRAHV